MVTTSDASLVLPVLIFLWAILSILSIPQPSKSWVTAITFTQVTAVTKNLL